MIRNSTLVCLFIFSGNILLFGSNQEPEAPLPATPRVTVTGREVDQLEIADTSSQGAIGAADLARRPLLRRGELLEAVPGVIITQHSGDGKANQYFLRGFNLDHGTDFALSVDGLPINLRTHGHGQGYADLNFIIPELVERIEYSKGPFIAEVGDFSAAGAAQFQLVRELSQGFATVTIGQNDFYRLALGQSWRVGPGKLTTAFEASRYSGPFEIDQQANRFNAFARYAWHSGPDAFAFTLMAYRGTWRSADQVPQRAIDAGLIPRLGSLDFSDGGGSSRVSLSFDWTRTVANGVWKLNAYAFHYRLDLFSNFTYFLADPVNGDQFHQADRRFVAGLSLARTWETKLAGDRPVSTTLGLQVRNDFIPKVALYQTAERAHLATVREDRVNEFSAGLYLRNEVRWTPWFRTIAGIRGDVFHFDVHSDTPENTGTQLAGIASPKLSLVFGPWAKTEFYLNGGFGFHSNDARGTTIRVSPGSGIAAAAVPPLVRSKSVEAGVRTSILPGLVSTLSVFYLTLDSELVFVGDAGDTEASNASRRYGIEWANFYRPVPWLTADFDVSWTHARFSDRTGLPGTHIPNSISTVVAAGLTVEPTGREGFYGTVRARYFGPQPLIEDNSVRARRSVTLNARVGYRWNQWDFAVDCLNLLDRRNNDISYFYASRLRGEPADGVEDLHVHPAEPRQFRVTLSRKF